MNRLNPLHWPRQLLLGAVHVYRYAFKPWVGPVCRYDPSCSAYALQALQRHGALGGTVLASWRLLRCNPWCQGGADPVPARWTGRSGGLFTRLLPRADAPDVDPPRPPIRKLP